MLKKSNRRGSSNPSRKFNLSRFKNRISIWKDASLRFAEVADREYSRLRKTIKENRRNLTQKDAHRIYQIIS